jgi:hypothetical protein
MNRFSIGTLIKAIIALILLSVVIKLVLGFLFGILFPLAVIIIAGYIVYKLFFKKKY